MRPGTESRNRRGEEGFALVAAILLVAGMVGLGILMITVSTRTNESSVEQRVREAAFQAADAGVSDVVACLVDAGSATLDDTINDCETALSDPQQPGYEARTQLSDEGREIGQYRILEVSDVTGTRASDPANSPQRWVRIDSLGIAPQQTGGRISFERRVIATIRLDPTGGFFDTLYAGGSGSSSGGITLKNNAIVNGSVYARNFDLVKNNARIGDVRTAGDFITKNEDEYSNIHAGGDVGIGNNTTVTGNVLSCGDPDGTRIGLVPAGSVGEGDVTFQKNSRIVGDLFHRGASSPTDPDPHVDSAIHSSPTICTPPPTLGLPTFTYDRSDYEAPEINPSRTVIEFTRTGANTRANDCLAQTSPVAQQSFCGAPLSQYSTRPLQSTLGTASGRLGGEQGVVVHVNDPACPTSTPTTLSGNRTFENDFTVITNCRLKVEGTWSYSTAYVSSATAAFISTSSTGSEDLMPIQSITSSDASLNVLLFTTGELLVRNNLNIASGAFYGGSITVNNNLDVGRSALLAESPPPGFLFLETDLYIPFVDSWREAPVS